MRAQLAVAQIAHAVIDARNTVVRMLISEPTSLARLAQRENGTGAVEQAQHSLRHARRMASEAAEGVIGLATDGKRPAELAEIILHRIGWRPTDG